MEPESSSTYIRLGRTTLVVAAASGVEERLSVAAWTRLPWVSMTIISQASGLRKECMFIVTPRIRQDLPQKMKPWM
jgi:hypothetical protein